MDKQLVEIQVRAYSENVTFRLLLLRSRRMRPSPAAVRHRRSALHPRPFSTNAKSPQHKVLRAFCWFQPGLFFLRFDGLARGFVFHFGFVFLLLALGGGVSMLGGVSGIGHGEEMRLVTGYYVYGIQLQKTNNIWFLPVPIIISPYASTPPCAGCPAFASAPAGYSG